MELTERQSKILNEIIGEYIRSAKPVSSKLLEKKHNFNVCPATIRIEMQKLADSGFISQPHTSAGRIPTDKGYRFYVDNFLSQELFQDFDWAVDHIMGGEAKDTIKILQAMTKELASFSSSLAIGYLANEKILLKEGWEDVVMEPEFKENDFVSHFAEAVKNLEEEIEDMKLDRALEVFIGKENPFPKAKEFSVIITRCRFPQDEGFLAIVGPKRMTYEKNINYLRSLMNKF